ERMFCVTAERARSLGPPTRRAAPPMPIRGGELLGEEFHLCAKPPSLLASEEVRGAHGPLASQDQRRLADVLYHRARPLRDPPDTGAPSPTPTDRARS